MDPRPPENRGSDGHAEIGHVHLRVANLELEMGRQREIVNGPRNIDIDVLLYGDMVVEMPALQIPHPRLHERRFALEPLAELEPALVVPGRGPVAELLAALD